MICDLGEDELMAILSPLARLNGMLDESNNRPSTPSQDSTDTESPTPQDSMHTRARRASNSRRARRWGGYWRIRRYLYIPSLPPIHEMEEK